MNRAVAAMTLAHALDTATFLACAAAIGIGGELNPIMRALYVATPFAVVAWKAATVVVARLFLGAAGADSRAGRAAATLVVVAGLFGAAANTATLGIAFL